MHNIQSKSIIFSSPCKKLNEVAESFGFCYGYEELVDFIERKKVFQIVFVFEYVKKDGKTRDLLFLYFQ